MDKKLLSIAEPGMRWYFLALFAFTAAAFWFDLLFGIIELGVAALICAVYLILRSKRRRNLLRYMETSLLNSDTLSSKSMLSFPLPMTVVKLQSCEIVWFNELFKQLYSTNTHANDMYDVKISDIIPGFELHWLGLGTSICPYDININDKIYTVTGAAFYTETSQSNGDETLAILYWQDKTETISLRRSMEDKNIICAEIVFDNYDEAMTNLTDSKKSSIQAALEKHLSDWIQPAEGIFRKIDRDRFILIFEEKYFKYFLDNKFDISQILKQDPITNEVSASLSIGIGREGDTLRDNMRNARLALDMALSRGGDQVVVRSRLNFDFYGGHGSEYEKRTKVKARLMANALSSLIRDCSDLYIMGHRLGDNDSLGASVGLICAGRKFGKRSRIVIDREANNTGAMLSMLAKHAEYNDVFITPDDALVDCSANSLLIIVDTNRPQYVESVSLLESFNRVAVIDHHRRATDYIDNAAVNVHEPSSSSTCEIVVELLQYMVNPSDIYKFEAVALLAGITLDTKFFTLKTGARTFDAAAFLRRIGADTVEVKHLFQNNFSNYLKRGELISHAVFYEQTYAIVKSPEIVDNTVAAQAADELLSVVGVRASFVIFPTASQICISARSLGEVNVQLILERLGGGGHLTTAGCQITGSTVDKVYSILTEAIDNYIAEE